MTKYDSPPVTRGGGISEKKIRPRNPKGAIFENYTRR